ncbi:restriction endonuclease subunit S [Rhodocytophaga aerolata]|uniref:Restriction endonuclease subunit S n=1 Tax=Rhodocytophaga aerolata TaxID=455078 RepID=A0ABT8RE29_9BACT|nr:restriction endonuclease subunit S [Rhodocytophaga aerolata]MDO1450348.1 restriction endonuclease subunit S [Rhodocytophaga aerolata]
MKYQLVKLSDCCEIISGSTPSRPVSEYWNGTIPWVTPKDLTDLDTPYIHDAPEKITKAGYDSCSTVLLPKNSVLLSSRAPIGHLAINTVEMCTNQGFKSLIPNDSVDSLYLFFCLKWMKGYLVSLGTGSTFKEISKAILSKVEIPLPSLQEQKRIAAVLDKADRIRQLNRQLVAKYEALTQSVFLEIFGDPARNEKCWPIYRIEEVASKDKYSIKAGPFGSALKKEFYVAKGYKIYGQEQVIRDDLSFGEYYIDEAKYRSLESCRIQAGDILISLVGTYGKISIVPENFEPGIINPRLMKITLNTNLVLPVFLKKLLQSQGVRNQIENVSRGGTMDIVNVGIMKNIEIPLPPIELQKNFVQTLKNIESQKTKAEQSLKKSEDLFNTLLQKAFRGELFEKELVEAEIGVVEESVLSKSMQLNLF